MSEISYGKVFGAMLVANAVYVPILLAGFGLGGYIIYKKKILSNAGSQLITNFIEQVKEKNPGCPLVQKLLTKLEKSQNEKQDD